KSGDYLVIRSHGVSPEIIEKLNEKGINVINGTCPSVLKVHKLAAQLSSSGYFIVLIGDKSHPEVNGIKGNIVSEDYKIINSVSEAKKINSLKKIAVLSQTTQTLKNFILISQEIVKKIKDEVLIINTLCNATEQRQIEINELSKKVDVMIIVGGRNSANTTHLAQISKNILNETYHIENASELKKEWFKNAKIAGLGGGASTPAEDIDEVKKIIQSI
ncbi:MAG: 4-hydroxy-3-methylbut-2-enyl diphosphate reductase, partial [Actinobacteria bacterium]|nr:4-hydroxy-3-methylbut-2-enyl diphosphate reductase [Actinomycetota bacterium]